MESDRSQAAVRGRGRLLPKGAGTRDRAQLFGVLGGGCRSAASLPLSEMGRGSLGATATLCWTQAGKQRSSARSSPKHRVSHLTMSQILLTPPAPRPRMGPLY